MIQLPPVILVLWSCSKLKSLYDDCVCLKHEEQRWSISQPVRSFLTSADFILKVSSETAQTINSRNPEHLLRLLLLPLKPRATFAHSRSQYIQPYFPEGWPLHTHGPFHSALWIDLSRWALPAPWLPHWPQLRPAVIFDRHIPDPDCFSHNIRRESFKAGDDIWTVLVWNWIHQYVQSRYSPFNSIPVHQAVRFVSFTAKNEIFWEGCLWVFKLS